MHKINTLHKNSANFPKSLLNIAYAPNELHYRGEMPDLSKPTIAVVGSRKPTKYGQQVTKTIVTELAKYGINIISGLAIGIDGMAHRAALEAGGYTAAVLPCRLQGIYPGSHTGLARTILDTGGALISEYAHEQPPQKYMFIERNRIVAGLADAVLIVEAARRSGTLSTARFALDRGIDVFAVPGPIFSPLSKGTNNLINQGAIPCTSAQDILMRFGITSTEQIYRPETAAEQQLLQLVGNGVDTEDILINRLQFTPALFNMTASELEIKGVLARGLNNKWQLLQQIRQ